MYNTIQLHCILLCIIYVICIFTSWTVRGLNPVVGGEIFCTRPALGPTQPPTQWVPGLSRE